MKTEPNKALQTMTAAVTDCAVAHSAPAAVMSDFERWAKNKMKPVPDHIVASGPAGTNWFGGAVDRSEMTLRVMAKVRLESVDKKVIADLLGCETDRPSHRHWCLHAPEMQDADIDSQVAWILGRVTTDMEVWKKITEEYRVDIFCGLFMERLNRGVSLSAKSMTDLSARGIPIGFDIYAPEK